MTGVLGLMVAAAPPVKRLDTTVHTVDFGENVNGYYSGAGGSIDNATFTDRGGNSRTIYGVAGDGGSDTYAQLWLAGTGIPNNDQTFAYIVNSGMVFRRQDATYNGSDTDGTSSWTWSNGIFVGGPSDHDLQVWA
jgi:hypothetical protein